LKTAQQSTASSLKVARIVAAHQVISELTFKCSHGSVAAVWCTRHEDAVHYST